MTPFIDEHRRSFGVEPICRTLAIAPSSYYAAKTRLPSARRLRDAVLSSTIADVHAAHFGVYGVRKLWRQLRRQGEAVGRDRVGRLMRGLGLRGVVREKRARTTVPVRVVAERPADLVHRAFSASAPNRLWVSDLTYVLTVLGSLMDSIFLQAMEPPSNPVRFTRCRIAGADLAHAAPGTSPG